MRWPRSVAGELDKLRPGHVCVRLDEPIAGVLSSLVYFPKQRLGPIDHGRPARRIMPRPGKRTTTSLPEGVRQVEVISGPPANFDGLLGVPPHPLQAHPIRIARRPGQPLEERLRCESEGLARVRLLRFAGCCKIEARVSA